MHDERPLSQEKTPLNEVAQDEKPAETSPLSDSAQDSFSTLNELIDNRVQKHGNLPAIGMALEEPLTYKQFHLRIICLARHLQAQGVKHGDRVALLAENSHNWGTVYLALVRLGAIARGLLQEGPDEGPGQRCEGALSRELEPGGSTSGRAPRAAHSVIGMSSAIAR